MLVAKNCLSHFDTILRRNGVARQYGPHRHREGVAVGLLASIVDVLEDFVLACRVEQDVLDERWIVLGGLCQQREICGQHARGNSTRNCAGAHIGTVELQKKVLAERCFGKLWVAIFGVKEHIYVELARPVASQLEGLHGDDTARHLWARRHGTLAQIHLGQLDQGWGVEL